jgi:hypothetical protein
VVHKFLECGDLARGFARIRCDHASIPRPFGPTLARVFDASPPTAQALTSTHATTYNQHAHTRHKILQNSLDRTNLRT